MTASRSRPGRALLLGLLLALLASAWTAATPARTVAASGDLTYTSSATYLVQPAARKVHVTLDVTATSHTRDTATKRFTIAGAYFQLMPQTAGFGATAGGQTLKVTSSRTAPTAPVLLYVPFGRPLASGQTYPFKVQFDLVDTETAPSRTIHLGKTLVSFPVWAYATSGTSGSSVRVVVPRGYSVSQDAGSMTSTVDRAGNTIYSSGAIADADVFYAWLTADTTPTYAQRTLPAIGPVKLTVRYWPDDPGWADAVAKIEASGLPALREAIGLGNPSFTSLTIEEVSSRTAGGYTGLFDPSTGLMQVSYLGDPFVLLHESSHLWFNRSLAGDRWIDEAFASYYADSALKQLKLSGSVPQLTPDLAASRIQLNDWGGLGNADSSTENYAYAATLSVAGLIAQRAGPAGLAKVWQAMEAGQAAYQPVHGAATEAAPKGTADWRELLDYLEQGTGQAYGDLWRQWIVDPAQAGLLDQRDAVRAAYAKLLAAAGSWELPAQIRQAMDAWQFAAANSEMKQATTTLAQSAEIVRRASAEGTQAPTRLRLAFEQATVTRAAAEAQDELSALDALTQARAAEAADAGVARNVGLLGSDPTALLAGARSAFAAGDLSRAASLANDARLAWEEAANMGQRRLILAAGIGIAALLLVLGFGLWFRGRRRRVALPEAGGPGGSAVAVAGAHGSVDPSTTPGDGLAIAAADDRGSAPVASAGESGQPPPRIPVGVGARPDRATDAEHPGPQDGEPKA